MRGSAQSAAAETAPAAARDVPRLACCEELERRQQGLWWGSHLFSLALHAAFVAWIVQTGMIVIEHTQRFGYGYSFGQAVMLASPLFELGERSALRGRDRQIPLSALVPQEKLYAPDLRRVLESRRDREGRLGAENTEEARRAYGDLSASALSVPFSGGGGALPAGTLPERAAGGVATPFDLVPPSNTRARRAGQAERVRLRVGDSNVPGGGANEGLRLPAAPARVGIDAEIETDSLAAPRMEEWLRVLVARLRRASFDLLPDRRDAGAPGMALLAVEVDRVGRIVGRSVAASSGNAALDRLAMALLGQLPGWQPLPQEQTGETLKVLVRVRYFPRR
jgi:TonB family protein